MEENPYRAPDAETRIGEARSWASSRAFASLFAGFCGAVAIVSGMIAAVVGFLDLPFPFGAAPFVTFASVVNLFAWIVAAWATWTRRWKTAFVAPACGVAAAAVGLLVWRAIFG